MNIDIIYADYLDPKQSKDIAYLLDCYARDPMGSDAPLPESVKDNLANALSQVPNAFSVIAYVDGKPAALTNCFQGFSTFKCKPLINVHDLMVLSEFRRLKLSHLMLEKVEQRAREIGCCKVTLEVLEGNDMAQRSYAKFGFQGYELDPEMGKALFWEKAL